MAKSVYSWGKAAQNGKKGITSVAGPKKPSVKSPKAGVRKTKKIKTGY